MGKRQSKVLRPNDEDASFELDLSPMLSLMVTLIPIMLLAAEFTRITVINTALPQVVEKAIQKDVKNKDKSAKISLKLFNNKSILVNVKPYGGTMRNIRIAANGGAWDLDKFHEAMFRIKSQHPKKFSLDVLPDAKVKYDDIVKVLDEARTTRKEEAKFQITDPETKETAETNLMFPEVTFSNILEG